MTYKILDRYIAGKYLRTFFFTVLMFSLITAVIDVSDKIEEFISESVPLSTIVFDYYVYWLLWIHNLLFPLYALVSVVFFTSRLAFNSEIISVLAAGVSFKRLLLAYMAPAFILFGIHMFANHILVPIGNQHHFNFQYTYIDGNNKKDQGRKSNVHIFLEPGLKTFVRQYNTNDSSLHGFRLEEIKDGELVSILRAEKAEWKGLNKGWKLKNYQVHTFDDMVENHTTGNSMDTLLPLTPHDFVEFENLKEMMATPALQEFINNERKRGVRNIKKYEVELQRRSAEPFTILILTIIGVAVASRKVRGGVGLHLAVGIGLGAVYILLSRFSTVFALNMSLPAMMGVWVPNVIFILIAGYLVSRAQQ